jgi:hypothetical protein
MELDVQYSHHASCLALVIQEETDIKVSPWVIKLLNLNLLRSSLTNEKHLAIWKQADAQINFSLFIKIACHLARILVCVPRKYEMFYLFIYLSHMGS